MTNENDLIQKLMMSKKIMDIHNKTPRGQTPSGHFDIPQVEEFQSPQASYNIPQDVLSEVSQPSYPSKKPNQGLPTQDRILASKLPDEIKKLMIEHPIVQPNQMSGPTLSSDLVEKAARLMNTDASGKPMSKTPQRQVVSESVLDNTSLRSILKEVVQEVLEENGLITESTTKSNDVFSFRVGKHIFEGKVTKIKKIQ